MVASLIPRLEETSHLATSIALHLWFFVAVTSPMSPARAFAVHALLQITLQLLNATSPPELSAEAQSPLESASKSATLVAVSDYKRTLTKFYIEVNLKKVAQVDAILIKYKVSDEALTGRTLSISSLTHLLAY